MPVKCTVCGGEIGFASTCKCGVRVGDVQPHKILKYATLEELRSIYCELETISRRSKETLERIKRINA